jgi:hypothetical protein
MAARTTVQAAMTNRHRLAVHPVGSDMDPQSSVAVGLTVAGEWVGPYSTALVRAKDFRPTARGPKRPRALEWMLPARET